MWKDPKVQGAAILFTVFLVMATVIAYLVPAMRSQYETFVFMGLGAMYSILLVMVKPDGGRDKQVSPSQSTDPTQGDK